MENITIIVVGIIAIFIISMVISSGQKTSKRTKDDFYKEQEERVKIGGYKKQPLLNQTEEIARNAILKTLEGTNNKLYAQVSLGEILKHENWKLYKDIQGKRADFVITDERNNPIAVIEIHGSGHYQNKSTTRRDEIKRSAVEDAGIKYLAVAVGRNQKEIYKAVFEKSRILINTG